MPFTSCMTPRRDTGCLHIYIYICILTYYYVYIYVYVFLVSGLSTGDVTAESQRQFTDLSTLPRPPRSFDDGIYLVGSLA